MDWLKRFLGLSNRSQQDPNSYRIPTWEEIRDHKNQPEWPNQQTPPDFSPPRTFSQEEFFGQHPGGMQDPFSSMFRQMDEAFGQMDNMFAQMDSMFGHLDGRMGGHQHQYHIPGQVIITELPDGDLGQDGELRQAPRDKLLKVPDSEIAPDKNLPQYSNPHQSSPQSDGDDGVMDSDNLHDGHPPGFGSLGSFQPFDPMSIFEGFIRGFGIGPFRGHPDQPMLPGPGDHPSEHHSRDSLLKKDSDLDDRDITQLPSEGPRYSYEGQGSGQQGGEQGWWDGQLSPRQHKSMFRSSTTVRIRRPDGSVREEKRYTDSTGREEVVVTDTKPDDSS